MDKLTEKASSFQRLTAVILAGGLGTRLRTAVPDRPKPIAEVHGRPFLAYLLDKLAAAGIESVVLSTGHLGKQVRVVFGDFYGNLRLRYSQESSPLGTGGALRLAIPLLDSDFVLVMNGDSYFDADLQPFWRWHWAKSAQASLMLAQVSDAKRFGRVQVDADGQVLRFDEKNGAAGSAWINAGIYLLDRRLLSTIPARGAVSLEREMFPAWIGHGFYGYQAQGRFLDIGTPESFAFADEFFA